jgi:hypothetical protein
MRSVSAAKWEPISVTGPICFATMRMRRRMKACMRSSPNSAFTAISSCSRCCGTAIARRFPRALPDRSAARPDTVCVSPENCRRRKVATTSSPYASRRTTSMKPSSTTYTGVPRSPTCHSHAPFSNVTSGPERRMTSSCASVSSGKSSRSRVSVPAAQGGGAASFSGRAVMLT